MCLSATSHEATLGEPRLASRHRLAASLPHIHTSQSQSPTQGIVSYMCAMYCSPLPRHTQSGMRASACRPQGFQVCRRRASPCMTICSLALCCAVLCCVVLCWCSWQLSRHSDHVAGCLLFCSTDPLLPCCAHLAVCTLHPKNFR
jgi:hypothetical protein